MHFRNTPADSCVTADHNPHNAHNTSPSTTQSYTFVGLVRHPKWSAPESIAMADERQFGTQELISAKYLAAAELDAEQEVEKPARRAKPRRSKLEQTVRWLTPLVLLMMTSAVGGLYWLNRASIASTAGEFNKRRSVIDLIFWASGSKETFNSTLSKRIEKAQRDSAFKTEFDHVDFENLSQAWNGGR
jgi:hypothetical protein